MIGTNTVIVDMALGRISENMIRHGLIPTTRAASTKSISRRRRTSPRIGLPR
jgi:hypothetical protein